MNAETKTLQNPPEKSPKEKGMINAREYWNHIVQQKKNELLVSSARKTTGILKQLLQEGKGVYYKNQAEKQAFAEALLNIVNRKRHEVRERHRAKKAAETRTAVHKTIGEYLDEGFEPQGFMTAEIDEQDRKKTFIEERDQDINDWHKQNDQSVQNISQMPQKTPEQYMQRAKANAELIMHQLNTGPRFEAHEREAIKFTLGRLLEAHLNGTRAATSTLKVETSKRAEKAAYDIFNRIKQQNNLAIAVLEELQKEDPLTQASSEGIPDIPTEKVKKLENRIQQQLDTILTARNDFMSAARNAYSKIQALEELESDTPLETRKQEIITQTEKAQEALMAVYTQKPALEESIRELTAVVNAFPEGSIKSKDLKEAKAHLTTLTQLNYINAKPLYQHMLDLEKAAKKTLNKETDQIWKEYDEMLKRVSRTTKKAA